MRSMPLARGPGRGRLLREGRVVWTHWGVCAADCSGFRSSSVPLGLHPPKNKKPEPLPINPD